MKPGISFTKIWFDDDMVELRIQVSNGRSTFVNEVYVGHQQLTELVADLSRFKAHVHGGIYDIAFGSFGPEYAHGAFHARLHFQDRGILFVTVKSQTDFQDFGKKNVASEATLYLKTEPALLDNFIAEVKEMSDGKRENAALETI
ncbi:MAG: hypothetical protein Q7U63_10145 [Polaromonas sp.]|uniref:hypothetical protein n=1 Tax=Polaromonas sp. TaxID=1869339 RepID=UPI0027188DA8|nr:hypothetical protein [Polaromonas sp.]MDO9114143.1 hypothetical protein [Polaromonas sp.]MDP1885625.1 hypothetical protein [Polaromonas sp.]